MLSWLYRYLQVPHSRTATAANVLALAFSILVLILAAILISLFGFGLTTPFVIGVAFVFWMTIALNKSGHIDAGRLIFCLTPVFLTLIISMLGKLTEIKQSYIIYFDARYLLLAASVLPAIVFDFEERSKLIGCLVVTFLTLMLFDPIHNLVGLGYYQKGFDVVSYYYINYITFISFMALVSGIIILKWRHWRASTKAIHALKENARVNIELTSRNTELVAITHEMEAQNEEILQQQEEMITNQEMLERANRLISDQKLKLEEYNLHLERLVEEKSGDLLKTNEELIKSNNELRQFSFTVSHNLRGPVARLLGLTRLVDGATDANDVKQITEFIHQSATELDSILKDLSTIIDIRSELYRVREKVVMEEEWNRAVQLIGGPAMDNVRVETSFQLAPYVFGIRPMIQSILFNLISNALKYRDPERDLVIKASTSNKLRGQIIFEIQDNGLGIDLLTQGENLFKLYKRFHFHVPGKGMGLYLVRSQMEIMSGRVEVESEPGAGTLFRMVFPLPDDLDHQVFFENDSAQLYYDALINNTVIIWKKNVTSDEYRKAFESVLSTIKKYSTPGWIADLRSQGVIEPEDQKWFVENVLQAAADNGLVRIAAVGFSDPVRKDYMERMVAMTGRFGIEFRMFDQMEEAVSWMKQFAR